VHLRKNEKKLSRSFNFTFNYIDDAISLNNSGDFVDQGNHDRKRELRNIVSTERYAGAAEMLPCTFVCIYKWKVCNGKIEIISSVVKCRS
jgi:hypothetical protein